MRNLSFSIILGKWRLMHLSLNALLIFGTWTLSQSNSLEEFSEELLLKPLPDGKVLTHFHFTNKLPPIDSYGHHHRLFPKAIYQLVQKFHIQEMEISFTQGRWNYDLWGGMDSIAKSNAKPSGVELWAVFGVPDNQIDATWRNLTHALSGLFCASLNFLESPAMIAKPVYTFRPHLSDIDSDSGNVCTANCGEITASGPGLTLGEIAGKTKVFKGKLLERVRYGALPREAVCTENLTPWLKLLPCRDKAGLTTLLERPVIYKGWYHSLRLYIRSDEFEPRTMDGHKGTLLQQTLTLVIEPSQVMFSRLGTSIPRMQPSWSLSSLFGRNLSVSCPLAATSVVYLELEGPLLENLQQFDVARRWKDTAEMCKVPGEHMASTRQEQAQKDSTEMQEDCIVEDEKHHNSRLLETFVENDAYVLHGVPNNLLWGVDVPRDDEDKMVVTSALLTFAVPRHGNVQYVDVGISWKVAPAWTPLKNPFRATRFLVGRGNARGAIATVLKSNHLQGKKWNSISGLDQISCADESSIQNVTSVMIFQVVPWYIRLYLHTLQVFVDEQRKPFKEVVTWMHVVPSEDRRSPGVIEMELRVPCNVTVIAFITEFDKGFLRIDEHPPDANRGFDLPSALVTFPLHHSDRQYRPASFGINKTQNSPLLRDFQKDIPVQVYTEVLLVPLATPDFSMPYNVITLTCTVLALYFGSLLNILRRRIGEEERLANSKEVPPLSKLEQLFSRLFGLGSRKAKDASSSKFPGIFKFVFVALVAIALNYYFANN